MKTILASLGAAIAAAVLAWAMLIGSTDTTAHTCKAPCVIVFDQPMAEDNFKLDYRPGGTLKVWKEQQ